MNEMTVNVSTAAVGAVGLARRYGVTKAQEDQADGIAAICLHAVARLPGRVCFAGTPAELTATAASRIWAADQRDDRADLSWRGGDGRWRQIDDHQPTGNKLVPPTVEGGYLLLSPEAGAR